MGFQHPEAFFSNSLRGPQTQLINWVMLHTSHHTTPQWTMLWEERPHSKADMGYVGTKWPQMQAWKYWVLRWFGTNDASTMVSYNTFTCFFFLSLFFNREETYHTTPQWIMLWESCPHSKAHIITLESSGLKCKLKNFKSSDELASFTSPKYSSHVACSSWILYNNVVVATT